MNNFDDLNYKDTMLIGSNINKIIELDFIEIFKPFV